MKATAAPLVIGSPREAGADRFGVIASVLCAIHCAVTPLLLLFAPAFGRIWAHPASHWIVALFVVPLALVMTVRGFQAHRKRWIVATGVIGVVLVVVGAIIPYLEPRPDEGGGTSAELGMAETAPPTAATASAPTEPSSDAELTSETPPWATSGDDTTLVWSDAEPLPVSDCAMAEAESCADSCCPSLVTDAEGNTQLQVPAASIVTTLGGIALICTHLGNLCACRNRQTGKCCDSPLC